MQTAEHVPCTAEVAASCGMGWGHVDVGVLGGMRAWTGRTHALLSPDEARRMAAELLIAAEEVDHARRRKQHG